MSAAEGDPEVVVVGGGAVGLLLASAFAEAGRRVTVCSRSEIPRLVVECDGEVREHDVATLVDVPADAAPAPWVVLATKAVDTAAAAPWLRAWCGPRTTLVVAQNGLERAAAVAPLVDAGAVVDAIVHSNVERLAPGRVIHRAGRLVVCPDGAPGRALWDLLAGSALEVQVSGDFRTEGWRKLVANAVANPITALTGRRMGVFREPAVRGLARAVLEEAVAVARADGAAIEPSEVDRLLAVLDGFPTEATTSMLADRVVGRPLEHREITGEIVDRARRLGVPVPVNAALAALLDASSGTPIGCLVESASSGRGETRR